MVRKLCETLSAKETLALRVVFPRYVHLPESRYTETRRVEGFDEEGKRMFEALSLKSGSSPNGRVRSDVDLQGQHVVRLVVGTGG